MLNFGRIMVLFKDQDTEELKMWTNGRCVAYFILFHLDMCFCGNNFTV